MSQNKKLVPKRRFKKFKKIEEWKLSYLGDLLEFYSGLTYSPKNIVEKGGTLVLRSSNVKDCELVLLDKVYVDSIYVNSEFVRYGDIIVVVRNGSKHLIGKHALIKKHIKNTVIGAFMTGIRYKIPEFMNSLLDTKRFNNEIEKNLGATINQITIGHFRKMMFYIPDDIEQKDIGAFFAKLDTLIQTQQKKLEKTKTLKLAYLAEMFPCDGESKPKLRFKNFDKIWSSTFLGLISQIKTGESDAQDSVAYGKYPFFVRSENIERSNRYLFDGEAILIPGEGRLGEIFHYINGKFDYHQRVYKISNFSNNIDGKFIYYLMQKDFKEHALKYTVKATVDSLRLPMLTNYRLKQPTLQEQNKVSSFFVKLDQKIALEQRKLEKLNNIKQAYLNEMFV
ncbi:restriction endonuclease subunit S [Gilliamella apicola]|uniref:restriction endonuclease subunit S n=1 Tax=Gilliamella apicola TaxID=1196095 RepID=UPI0039879682